MRFGNKRSHPSLVLHQGEAEVIVEGMSSGKETEAYCQVAA